MSLQTILTMTQRIEKIEDSKHKKERVLLFLSDGNLLKVTKNELLKFGLKVGMELPSELQGNLEKEAKKSEFRVQAAQMASKRILSKKEVIQKLKAKGAEEETAEEMAQWLEELGAVNDENYAGVVVRHYSSMGYGQGRIRQELQKRGIDKTLWEDALESMPDMSETLNAFITKKLSGKEPTKENLKKVSDALLRRGFSWEEIKSAMNQYGNQIWDGQTPTA